MNILPCEIKNGQINFEGKLLPNNTSLKKSNFSKTQVGIRPEFINFSKDGIKVKIKRVSDTGRHKVIDTECKSGSIKILASSTTKRFRQQESNDGGSCWLHWHAMCSSAA